MTEHHPATVQIARFGLPLIILIYYTTASLSFEYTPDSTYSMLQQVKVMSEPGLPDAGWNVSSPLWMLLIMIGRLLHGDALVTAKVFSLFFCSFIILFSYLLANEVLRDRLLSFCVALVVAMQWWLLQAGPSGSALGFGLLLSLVSVFFLLRNEYLLSAVFVGLTTLVFWQAVGLIALLMADVTLNSVDRRRAAKVMAGVALAYCGVVLPWVLYAAAHGLSMVPTLAPSSEFPGFSLVAVCALSVLCGLTIAAVIVISRSGEEGRMVVRTQAAPLLWIGIVLLVGSTANPNFLYMGIPLLIVYGFLGLRELLIRVRSERMVYAVAIVLTGLLILQNQVTLSSARSATIQTAIDENKELLSLAIWLKANTSGETLVVTDKPGIIGYYSDLPVAVLGEKKEKGHYIVSKATKLDGYDLAFTPTGEGAGEVLTGKSYYSVWKRK